MIAKYCAYCGSHLKKANIYSVQYMKALGEEEETELKNFKSVQELYKYLDLYLPNNQIVDIIFSTGEGKQLSLNTVTVSDALSVLKKHI